MELTEGYLPLDLVELRDIQLVRPEDGLSEVVGGVGRHIIMRQGFGWRGTVNEYNEIVEAYVGTLRRNSLYLLVEPWLKWRSERQVDLKFVTGGTMVRIPAKPCSEALYFRLLDLHVLYDERHMTDDRQEGAEAKTIRDGFAPNCTVRSREIYDFSG